VYEALQNKLSDAEKEYLEERMRWDKNWLSRRKERYPNGQKITR